jgi:transposase-like protein
VSARYQVLPPTAPVPAPDDALEELVRRGAQRLLQEALGLEVDEFLGRLRYRRDGEFRGYRNGHLPARQVGTGMGAVEIRQPRVSDVPEAVDPFRSEIVGRYERRSHTQARLLARLYLEGLATGDFEPVFRALVGETAALSPALSFSCACSASKSIVCVASARPVGMTPGGLCHIVGGVVCAVRQS